MTERIYRKQGNPIAFDFDLPSSGKREIIRASLIIDIVEPDSNRL